jgi:hypothetical protein
VDLGHQEWTFRTAIAQPSHPTRQELTVTVINTTSVFDSNTTPVFQSQEKEVEYDVQRGASDAHFDHPSQQVLSNRQSSQPTTIDNIQGRSQSNDQNNQEVQNDQSKIQISQNTQETQSSQNKVLIAQTEAEQEE